MKKKLNNILIIGLGMMGGSLCRSIKKNKVSKKITAFDINRKSINYAIRNKIIDQATDNYDTIDHPDLIILCTPLSGYITNVKKILSIYKRQGFFSTFIEPKYIKNSGNRVDIIFEIYEGKEAKIKRINFLNNKVFSDSTLEDVISSAEYRWYEFWGSNDKFDKERINYDKDLLKDYDGEIIRLAMLGSHYRQPLIWSDDLISQSKKTINNLYNSIKDLDSNIDINNCKPDDKVLEALHDDLNTPKALAEIFSISKNISKSKKVKLN